MSLKEKYAAALKLGEELKVKAGDVKAIAYAIYRGAEEIRLYGIDFSYPNAHKVEKGRACVEYWIGRAVERGVKVTLPEGTTLMDMNCQGLYGYDAHHVLNDFSMIPKDIPSAAEMEARYGLAR